MRNVCSLAIALAVLAVPEVLLGQVSGAQGASLSFQEARREAIARDPQLAELKAEVDAAHQRAAQSQFLDPPMLEGQIWQWPLSTPDPSRVDMYMLSASQEFPGRGKRALRAAVLRQDAAVLEPQVEARQRQVEADVRAVYVELASVRKARDIQLGTEPLLRQAIAVSQARYESGAISQGDVLEGVLAVSKLHDDLLMLDENEQSAAARLNALMLRDTGTAIGPLDDLDEPGLLLPIDELERRAIERHPEILGAATLSERAAAMAAEAQGDLKPDFRVSGGVMLRPREGDAWMASVGVTWPKAPWARGKADARVAEAHAEASGAQARRDAAVVAIHLQIRESYIKATTARQRVLLLRSTILPQSRQSIALASAAYQTDRVDFQTVIAQQRMLLEAQLAYTRALGDEAQAVAQLERIVGSNPTMAADGQ